MHSLALSAATLASLLDRCEFLLGDEGAKANPWQVIVRSVLVYGFAVLLVRLGHKRFLGRNSGIDIILSIILGSVLSRGINGSSPLGSTLAASTALVGVHWVFAAVTFHHKTIGKWLKGEPRILVENGQTRTDIMRGSHISDDDLHEAMRIQGKLNDVSRVEKAQLERNGDISVLEKKPAVGQPRVLEITVVAGVQTIRVALE